MIAHHDALVILGLPFKDLCQRLLGCFSAGQKIDDNRCQDESHRHGVGVGRRPHPGNLANRVAVDARAHIERSGDTGLMQHGEKVEHAAAEPFGRKQKPQLRDHGFQPVLVKVPTRPVRALVHLCIGLGHAE